MKIANVMCFARGYNSVQKQFAATAAELALIREFDVENTFLLQYDAVCNEDYQNLFSDAPAKKTEVGLWYEIVEPLAEACGIPYRSKMGLKWDYHIIPGFPMGYTTEEREQLIDEAMRKFKEVFGYYPKTVASWVMDTHTVNYLTSHYEISALAICRDQVNFDAYTLMGGYFNQAYYPSKNNMFTPAQTEEYRVDVPVFRLLGPCPIHNYELEKYFTPDDHRCCTLEPIWCPDECNEGLFKAYYENESLGFAYAQLGQENTLRGEEVFRMLRIQLEKLSKMPDVMVTTMSRAGELFKQQFPQKTPATAVVATENWSSMDLQAVSYNSQHYTANLFRFEDSLSLRSLFLFDETVEDHYLTSPCTTSDAIFENLPVVDTQLWFDDSQKKECGLVLDGNATPFTAEKAGEGRLRVQWRNGFALFEEDRILCKAGILRFYLGKTRVQAKAGSEIEHKGNRFYVNPKPEIVPERSCIRYSYKGKDYSLQVKGGEVCPVDDGLIEIRPTEEDGVITLLPMP